MPRRKREEKPEITWREARKRKREEKERLRKEQIKKELEKMKILSYIMRETFRARKEAIRTAPTFKVTNYPSIIVEKIKAKALRVRV